MKIKIKPKKLDIYCYWHGLEAKGYVQSYILG